MAIAVKLNFNLLIIMLKIKNPDSVICTAYIKLSSLLFPAGKSFPVACDICIPEW